MSQHQQQEDNETIPASWTDNEGSDDDGLLTPPLSTPPRTPEQIVISDDDDDDDDFVPSSQPSPIYASQLVGNAIPLPDFTHMRSVIDYQPLSPSLILFCQSYLHHPVVSPLPLAEDKNYPENTPPPRKPGQVACRLFPK